MERAWDRSVAPEYVHKKLILNEKDFYAVSDIAGASRQEGCCAMRRGDDRSGPRKQLFCLWPAPDILFPKQGCGICRDGLQMRAHLKTYA